MAAKKKMGTLDYFAGQANHSWIDQLVADPETEKHAPNKVSREVRSGHYVLVRPTPLPDPYLVTFSLPLATELGLSKEECSSKRFTAFFSGDADEIKKFKTWATPYALSIHGQEMYQNCPFGNGNGYGDGRAISIAEVSLENGSRWELQLKGAGTTPFCRSGDGRAVLRSSVREFLVSEAMHNMGVSTTRALSLVASKSAHVRRPWYDNNKDSVEVPTVDDPRLAHVPKHFRKQLIAQLRDQARNPDVMQMENMAITCRVATSFLRVGHMELHARRVRASKGKGVDEVKLRRAHLSMIAEHALLREYPNAAKQGASLGQRVLAMLKECSNRMARLTADWIRVGYCQGNFNSDNCLVGGRTMDYGPFGFMEKFTPLWNMWASGGDHFGFLNQPTAGHKNFQSLVDSLTPLLDEKEAEEAEIIGKNHYVVSADAVNDMWRQKLGLNTWTPGAAALLKELTTLLEDSEADYTMTWRQLAVVAERSLAEEKKSQDDNQLVAPLADVFYAPLSPASQDRWTKWLKTWLALLVEQGQAKGVEVAAAMRRVSPKYVPREWMLVQAYSAAIEGKFAQVKELQQLFERPYDEQPAMEVKFYKKAPADVYEGAGKGGTAFMS